MSRYRLLKRTTNSLIFNTVFILFLVNTTLSLNFSQIYTGVSLLPHVCSKDENGGFPYIGFYTPKHVRVMLQVIAQKFSHVLVFGMAHPGGDYKYVPNNSYNNDIYAEGHTAEQAASVNKEMGRRSLTIIQGVWNFRNGILDDELKLAIEATQRANKLYSGTVTGIVITDSKKPCSEADAKRSLKYFRIIRNSSVPFLEVGAIWECDKLRKDLKTYLNTRNPNVFATFLIESDIIICNVPDVDTISFEDITENLLRNRNTFLKLNPRIRVMALTKWTNVVPSNAEELLKFRLPWKEFNNFAEKNEFPVYFDEAIKNPNRDDGGPGWWRLSDNLKIDQISGYIEQAPDPYAMSTEVKVVVIIFAILGAVILLKLVLKCVITLAKYYDWASILTEFENGLENHMGSQKDEYNPCFEALKIPFDKSFEIANAQIKFQAKNITQNGQVRCCHKAGISSQEQSKIVALLKIKKAGRADDVKEMLDEAKILMYLRGHPNIITVEGVFTESLFLGQVQVALEFCNLGSLDIYLKAHVAMDSVPHTEHMSVSAGQQTSNDKHLCTCNGISSQQMMLWSHGIASGMDYLDSKEIIHGSLATSNVLLSFNKTAKVAGFKLKRRIAESTKFIKTGKQPTMWRWLSVESLRKCEFSKMSDVWSFGITAWEIFSMGALPYADIHWAPDFVKNLESGLRLKSPQHATPEFFQMIEKCWELQANQRPKFAGMKQILQSVLDSPSQYAITNLDNERVVMKN